MNIQTTDIDSDEELIDDDDEEELTELNRMKLLKMSRSNNFYLFEDRLDRCLKVYRLDSISYTFQSKRHRIFQFVLIFKIDILRMNLVNNILQMQNEY